MKKCSLEHCQNKYKAKGYCSNHYKLSKKYNDLSLVKKNRKKGLGCIRKDGYKITCEKGVNTLEHRSVYEKYHGVKIREFEVVHHIDDNPLNNSIENLMLFKNQSAHLSFHNKKRNEEKFRKLGETDMLKFCPKCKKLLALTEYHKNPCHRRGYHTYCKICKKSFGGIK